MSSAYWWLGFVAGVATGATLLGLLWVRDLRQQADRWAALHWRIIELMTALGMPPEDIEPHLPPEA